MTLLRSLLFAPGNVARRLEKALSLPADVVILDLEDAVPLSEKNTARSTVVEALQMPRQSRAFVRVNALATGLTVDDLNAVLAARPDGIVLPKVETATDLHIMDWYLAYWEQELGMPRGSFELLPLVESARGVENAYSIAAATPRVKCLSFGAIDYTTDLGVKLTREATEILYARSRLVNASRAAESAPPIDTVFPDIKDLEGLIQDSRLGRQLGFQGKLVIHPDQVDPVNQIFSPSSEEIAYAYRVIEAFSKAEAEGSAAITLEDGKFIDYAVLGNARRIIALAEEIKKIK